MEFNEKLKTLRKQKGLTQEELAEALFVSRTAVSKWESGRGYPSIDSLKAIASFFSVTLDELISGSEPESAPEESAPQEPCLCSRLLIWLDLSAAAFLFLPLFAQQEADGVRAVSLLFLSDAAPYMKGAYLTAVACMLLSGLIRLLPPERCPAFLSRSKCAFSFLPNAASLLLLILGRQPYAAAFAFILLVIRVFPLVKGR